MASRTVTLKTLHGKFEFKLQKYDLDVLGVSLDLCQQMPVSYISRGFAGVECTTAIA